MKKILVTGGAGFIGSHLVDELIKKGHEVKIFDNLEPQVHKTIPNYINKNAEFIKGDVREKKSLYKALQDIDVIFHDAAMVGVGQSMYQVEKYVDVNTFGTAKLLDSLVNSEHSIKKLIVASSMSIYGEGAYKCQDCGVVYPSLRPHEQLIKKEWELSCPHCKKSVKPIPTNETKPLQPTSIYAISKKDQEEMSLAIGRSYGIPTVALRYFNTYGPRQSLNNPYTGVCAIFSARIKNNNPPIIFEDGMQSRDFISVRDIVQANVLAMEKSNANYEVFNVGSGQIASIKNVAEILSKMYDKNIIPTITNTSRAGDIRHCFADITKITSMLKFKPNVKLVDGMRELVQWGESADSIDSFEDAHQELKTHGLLNK
jgi:dTDP-L-rhamnose 4-epimerase